MNFIKYALLTTIFAPVMMLGSASSLAQDNDGGIRNFQLAPAPAPALAGQGGRGVAILSAVVDADGTLNRGSGVISATNVNAGSYEVIFRRNVRDCTYVATIGIPGSVGTALPGEINVAGANVSASGVFVDIQNSAGVDVNHPFHLLVFCHE